MTYKVLIAEDERIIREGIAGSIDWDGLGLVLAGLAKDGEQALEIVNTEKPDICLVDIMMPKVNGMELIERARSLHPEIAFVIISGYDEFGYAQRSIQLGVWGYLLKPVSEDELNQLLGAIIQKFSERNRWETRIRDAETKIRTVYPVARTLLLQDCLAGTCDKNSLQEFERTYGVEFSNRITMFVVPATECVFNGRESMRLSEKELIGLVCAELKSVFEPRYNVLMASAEEIGAVAIVEETEGLHIDELTQTVEAAILEHLGYRTMVYARTTRGGLLDLNELLQNLRDTASTNGKYSPVLRQVKDYVDAHYFEPGCSLKTIAESLNFASGYISRVFKRELGVSFSDYLEQKRIDRAVVLLREKNYRIYEIAEKVGYSSQHYFCTAFKKITGQSPSDYKSANKSQ